MHYEEPEKERNNGMSSLQTVAYVQMLHSTVFSKRCFKISLFYKMYAVLGFQQYEVFRQVEIETPCLFILRRGSHHAPPSETDHE